MKRSPDEVAREKYEAFCQRLGVSPAPVETWAKETGKVKVLNMTGNTGDSLRKQVDRGTQSGVPSAYHGGTVEYYHQ